MADFEGKVALITGGGTGIGRATALQLAAQGAVVAVNYSRSRQEAEDTAAEIRAAGARALVVQADVADDAQVRTMVAATVAEFGRLDFLVNNAGRTRAVPLPGPGGRPRRRTSPSCSGSTSGDPSTVRAPPSRR